jgi:hypothetical protein
MALAAGLVGLGWIGGAAQTRQPDFEVIVKAPAGETTIECVRGCQLGWVERGLNASSTPRQSFSFGCSGDSTGRCSSGKVGGWIEP